jgi:hypothetical protein
LKNRDTKTRKRKKKQYNVTETETVFITCLLVRNSVANLHTWEILQSSHFSHSGEHHKQMSDKLCCIVEKNAV